VGDLGTEKLAPRASVPAVGGARGSIEEPDDTAGERPDALDFGESTLFYEVTVAAPDHRRHPRMRGLGEFADLRRLALLTEASR
jgi:hypothetical protein